MKSLFKLVKRKRDSGVCSGLRLIMIEQSKCFFTSSNSFDVASSSSRGDEREVPISSRRSLDLPVFLSILLSVSPSLFLFFNVHPYFDSSLIRFRCIYTWVVVHSTSCETDFFSFVLFNQPANLLLLQQNVFFLLSLHSSTRKQYTSLSL